MVLQHGFIAASEWREQDANPVCVSICMLLLLFLESWERAHTHT